MAGAKAAAAAREGGHDGPIVLIGEEPTAPYERPPLSKAVLRGEAEPQSARVHPDGFYDEHAIEVVQDRVVALDAKARDVELASGARITFDSAVIATGAEPRRLSVPGADLTGVHYLRTIDDSLQLADAIRAATRVAVIGAGWIGSEVAASARQMGADVVLIDPLSVPLQRVLGDEIGEVFRRLHADHGVDPAAGCRGHGAARRHDGRGDHPHRRTPAGRGPRRRRRRRDPEGRPRRHCRLWPSTTASSPTSTSSPSVPGIYAAGDVANAWHPHYGRRLRVEHWANALNQGVTAGRNAAGGTRCTTGCRTSSPTSTTSAWSTSATARPTTPSPSGAMSTTREFIAFWHRDGVVTAAMNVNVWDVVEDLKAIVASGHPVELDRLIDEGVALADLV